MAAIAELLSYPNKINSFHIFPQNPAGIILIHLAILSACIFFKHYQIFATRRDYAAAIKNSSSKFTYRRKMAAAAEDSGDECSVCLSDYSEGEECCRLAACGHAFHRRCVERWLLRGCVPTCPLCRAAVVPEAAAAEYRRLQTEGDDDWIEKEM